MHIVKSILSLSQCQNENEANAFREEAFVGPQSGRIQK